LGYEVLWVDVPDRGGRYGGCAIPFNPYEGRRARPLADSRSHAEVKTRGQGHRQARIRPRPIEVLDDAAVEGDGHSKLAAGTSFLPEIPPAT
jgi:hypothetical protein